LVIPECKPLSLPYIAGIHHNPVSGKWILLTNFMDYEYSSARFYESGEPGKITIYYYLDAPTFSEFSADNAEED